MDPLTYCLFMLSCFGSPREQTDLLKCPEHCECYQASSDGIGGSDAESFVCNDLTFLSANTLNTKLINTFVLRNVPFQTGEYNFPKSKKYSTISLYLENFSHNVGQAANAQYIFNLFDHRSLKYLTILKSQIFSSLSPFEWTSINSFVNLEIINIDNSNLPALDESFASLELDKLHTLIVKSSSLEHIDREALVGKSNLHKVIITNNAIRNWNWLTSLQQPLSELWHLDLTSNRLNYIPENLKSVLPNLRVFHLAHNRLRYFSYSAMQPWFAINVFQPTNGKLDEKDSKTAYNYIFYDDDFEKIIKTSDDITAEYFADSIGRQIHYVCTVPKVSTQVKAVNNWDQFNQFCRPPFSPFDYLPDNLRVRQVEKDIQLEGYLENGKETVDTVFIRGLDQSTSLANANGNQIFYFDSTSTQAKYRQNRAHLMNLFNSFIGTPPNSNNAIRLHLFGKTMLDYFLGKSVLTNEHIRMIIDLVVDALDEAAEKRCYVMLIMWNHADVVDSLRGQTLDYVNSQNIFKETILQPLLNQISRHPALIGIEIMNQFLSNQIPLGTPEDENNRCLLSKWDSLQIKQEIHFLGANAAMVKQLVQGKNGSGGKLIGVSVDANCQQCFRISMIELCRTNMQFRAQNGYDFVTFINGAKEDTYSYTNFQAHAPDWIHKPDDTVPLMKVHNRAIFHVVQQTTFTEAEITANEKSASGLFVVQ